MSSIVQKAHGIVAGNGGTLSFPNPTTPGNAIVVIFMLKSGGAQFQVDPPANVYITDDSGSNVYDFVGNKQFVGFNTLDGNNTVIFGQIGQSAPSTGAETLHCAPMQTFTFDHWVLQEGSSIFVWAYEITYADSSDAGPPAVFWFGNSNQGGDVTNAATDQLVLNDGSISGSGGDTSPKVNLYFAAVAPFTGQPTAVGDNLALGAEWTLDTVQNGWGVGYAEVIGNADQQAKFTNSESSPYAGLWLVIADVGASAPNVIVRKVTHPSGSEQGFEFTTNYGAPFTLHDGEQNDSGPLGPGTYSLAETPVEGWTTGMLARNQDGHIVTIRESGSFDLLAGETVTITVTNATQKVIVKKETTPPGNLQEFTFHSSWGEDFTLQGGETNDSGRLEPGTYSVAEDPVEGWRTSVAAVDQDGNPVAIAEDGSFPLAAGQIVTVTFTNIPPSPPGPNHILTMSYFNGWHDPLMMTLSGEWVANRQARRWNIDPIPTRAMALVKRTLAAKVDQRVNYRQLLLGKYAAAAGPASLLYMQPGAYDDLGAGYESKYRLAYSSEKPSQEFPAGGRVMGWRAYDGHALGQGMLLISPWTPDPTYTHKPYQRDLNAGKKQIPGSAPVTHIDGSLNADSEFFTLEFSNGGVAGAWFQLVELAAFGRAKVYSAG